MSVLITKADGEREPFDEHKLKESLERSRAPREVIENVVKKVTASIRDGMTTEEIYKHAFSLLATGAVPVAARYSMKRAVLELGPSGFPFEDFVGEIFKAKGFKVQTGVVMQGLCVEHEVDLSAFNEKKELIGEVKFHNELGLKSDLKVALYVQARIEDLQAFRQKSGRRPITEGWLITNTKFTKSAISYAACKGIKMISWTYPKTGNLHDLIEETQVHPVTCLTTLTRHEKLALLESGIVLCKSVPESALKLKNVGITGERI